MIGRSKVFDSVQGNSLAAQRQLPRCISPHPMLAAQVINEMQFAIVRALHWYVKERHVLETVVSFVNRI